MWANITRTFNSSTLGSAVGHQKIRKTYYRMKDLAKKVKLNFISLLTWINITPFNRRSMIKTHLRRDLRRIAHKLVVVLEVLHLI